MPDPNAVPRPSLTVILPLPEQPPLRRFRNIPVVVEQPLGSTKRGTSPAGKPWVRVYGYLPNGEKIPGFVGYGCIPRTVSADGEDLDVYLGSDEAAELAYLIEQGAPDPEHKLMLGWPSAEAAVACYTAHVPAEMLVGITPVPVALIQALVGAPFVTKSAPPTLGDRIAKAAQDGRRSCALRKAAEYIATIDEIVALDGAPKVTPMQTVILAPPDFAHPCISTPLSGAYVGAFATGWLGWIEPYPRPAPNPRDPSFAEGVGRQNVNSMGDWIAFVGVDGWGLLWEQRLGGDGGVLGTPILFRRAPEMRQEDLSEVQATAIREGLPDVAAIASVLTKAGAIVAVQKPFAGFENFGACVAAQRANGHDEESARRICGALQARVEKAADEATVHFITKSALEQRYILGVVLEPLDPAKGEADKQGDFYTAEEIRKAMWLYMIHFRGNVSNTHKAFLNGKVHLIECWQTLKDDVIYGEPVRAGTWLAGFYIPDDEVWDEVRSGGFDGLSIGGAAKKTPLGA